MLSTLLVLPTITHKCRILTTLQLIAVETLGGLHKGAVTQVKLLASALAKCKGLEEGEVTGQMFGRLSLTLMRANALMLSSQYQDADFPLPKVDGIQ